MQSNNMCSQRFFRGFLAGVQDYHANLSIPFASYSMMLCSSQLLTWKHCCSILWPCQILPQDISLWDVPNTGVPLTTRGNWSPSNQSVSSSWWAWRQTTHLWPWGHVSWQGLSPSDGRNQSRLYLGKWWKMLVWSLKFLSTIQFNLCYTSSMGAQQSNRASHYKPLDQ